MTIHSSVYSCGFIICKILTFCLVYDAAYSTVHYGCFREWATLLVLSLIEIKFYWLLTNALFYKRAHVELSRDVNKIQGRSQGYCGYSLVQYLPMLIQNFKFLLHLCDVSTEHRGFEYLNSYSSIQLLYNLKYVLCVE